MGRADRVENRGRFEMLRRLPIEVVSMEKPCFMLMQ
jgi:hypothetical protein